MTSTSLSGRCLSHVVDEACFQQLLDSAPTYHSRALALSFRLPHAGDWLNIIPSTTLGFHLHDREFRCCLRYWLGVPLHSSSYPCPKCHLTANAYVDHQVGCGENRDRIARHNAVRDAIHAASQSAALAPSKETPGLLPGSQARPGDIFIHAGALDVQSPLICSSSARYRSPPSLRLLKHLAMPSKLVCRESLQPTSQHAAIPGRTSSLWWLRH